MVEDSMIENEETLLDEENTKIYLDEEDVTPLDVSNLEFLN